jgi:hypothetical protein
MKAKSATAVPVLLTILAIASQAGIAQTRPAMELSILNDRIQYGDPLLLRVSLVYETPPALRAMPAPLLYLPVEDLDLRVRRMSGPTPSEAEYRFYRTRFAREDEKGLRFGANLALWYQTRKGAKNDEIVFGSPGTYEIAFVDREDQLLSNTVRVVVESSAIGEKVLTQIAEPNDLKFLADGVVESPRTVAHLEEIVEQAQGTVLSRMAAARLGLVYFHRLEAKHPDGERFVEEYRKGAKEPLFENARRCLAIGAQLPGPFPIREKVLHLLAGIRFAEGNYDAAESVLSELGRQFPQGEYGRRAAETQAEFRMLRKRLSQD